MGNLVLVLTVTSEIPVEKTTIETIKKDAERFSRIYDWNKKLCLHPRGDIYFLYFAKREKDDVMHLHFRRMGAHENANVIESLHPVCFENLVIITRNFGGDPENPDSPIEQERQSILKDIQAAALDIAIQTGILKAD
jgi:hypothetical protein